MRIKRLQGEKEKRKGCHYEFDLDAKPMGEGGMGVVYHGYRVDDSLGSRSEVAIKILHEELSEEVYARAEREASIQLRHDNLVEMLGFITEFETDQFGTPVYRHYVISEFLHGVELSDLLKGSFDSKEGKEIPYAKQLYNRYIKEREATSIEIIRCISSGVLALHDKGYIHRDIDPSNIMVTVDGSIKLIDFGIAKNLQTLGTKDKLTTSTGKFIGKAEYASPELVLGDVKSQNYSTDIYALGIVLYRLLVGHLPFEGNQYDVLQKQLHTKVPVRKIENKALARVVKKATDKVQNHRYSSIAEFRVALDAVTAYKPNIFALYWKQGVAVAVLAIISACTIHFWPSLGGGYEIVKEKTKHEIFNEALTLLDSSDAKQAKDGLKQMQKLVEQNYDSAKCELAMTYFPNENLLSSRLTKRRNTLGINEKDYNRTLSYLKNVADSSCLNIETFYIIGCIHLQKYNNGYDTLELKNAAGAFEKAKKKIEKGLEAGHGYDLNSLKIRIEENNNAIKQVFNRK